MLADYIEAVRTLAKSTGNGVPGKTKKAVIRILDQYEPSVHKAVTSALTSARKRFVNGFQVHAVVQRFESLGKSVSDDVQSYIRNIIASTYGSEFVDEIMEALAPAIADVIKQLTAEYRINTNFDLANEAAIKYLREKADNTFSEMTDGQARGIYSQIADTISDKYSLLDVVSAVRQNFISDTMYFKTDAGVRAVDANDWAFSVARTETARAASFAQKAVLEDVGMKTWQWNVQDTGCDICDEADEEIVAIGDPFATGDTEPPAHPNCRCVVTAVLDELTSDDDD
jgi:uncharacterized protein with gpF-like domain